MLKKGRALVRYLAAASGAFWLLASLASPAAAQSQSQPGRFLVSPRQDTIFECNIDASNCFHVTGAAQSAGDPAGGDQEPSAAIQPSIAQNGTIAFMARYAPDGTCSGLNSQGTCAYHVFAMDAGGTNARQVTFNPPNNGPSTFFYSGDFDVSISPDGTMAAFVSNRNDAYDTNGTAWSSYAVYVVNIDGSGLRQVTPFTYDASGSPQETCIPWPGAPIAKGWRSRAAFTRHSAATASD